MRDTVIDLIYEAAFVPDAWSKALQTIAEASGSASGSLLFFPGPGRPIRFRASPVTEAALQHHIASGEWRQSRAADTTYRQLDNPTFAGFGYMQDFMSEQEIAEDSVRKGLNALGLDAQIGTLVPMMTGEVVGCTFERWRDLGRHSPEDIALLHELRPHLARSCLMAARLGLERAASSVAAMAMLGLPAVVLAANGRVLAANALAERAAGPFRHLAHGRLALATTEADRLFRTALQAIGVQRSESVQSIPVVPSEERPAAVVHAVPLRRAAFDIFSGGEVMLIASELPLDQGGPPVNLLMGLFDLTAAEARIAAALTAGKTLQEAAQACRIQVATARGYLAQIFRKTGMRQQSQLVGLLSGVRSVTPG